MWVGRDQRPTPKDRGPGNHSAAGPFGVWSSCGSLHRSATIDLDEQPNETACADLGVLPNGPRVADDLARPGD